MVGSRLGFVGSFEENPMEVSICQAAAWAKCTVASNLTAHFLFLSLSSPMGQFLAISRRWRAPLGAVLGCALLGEDGNLQVLYIFGGGLLFAFFGDNGLL